MTNEELDKAIDTAATHSGTSYGHAKCGELMLAHLKALLAIQLERAKLGADKDQQARDYAAGLAKGIKSMGADKTGERE